MMMIKRKMLSGRSDLAHFQYLLVLLICLYVLVGGFASYDINANCGIGEDIINDNYGLNITSDFSGMEEPDAWDFGSMAWAMLTGVWNFIYALFSGCTGVPSWIYITIFVIPLIVIVLYVIGKLPVVGSG